MIDRDITISNLETNIRWIEDNPQHQFPGWGNVTMAMRDAVELLKEQEVKTGNWIEYPKCLAYDGAYDDSWIVCSSCKHPFNIIDNCAEEFDYCPHCGAKMKGGEVNGQRESCQG